MFYDGRKGNKNLPGILVLEYYFPLRSKSAEKQC